MENFEIERKFLIKMPDEFFLEKLVKESGGEIWHITQTYLTAPKGVTSRVRKVECGDKTIYFRTDKIRVSAIKRVENEREIADAEYLLMKKDADSALKEIKKTRYRIPSGKFKIEIDVFPFWKKQAFLEIELESEDESFSLPEYVSLIREVTKEPEYTNRALAGTIPEE